MRPGCAGGGWRRGRRIPRGDERSADPAAAKHAFPGRPGPGSDIIPRYSQWVVMVYVEFHIFFVKDSSDDLFRLLQAGGVRVEQRVIHERSRLSILSSLAVHGEGLLFNDLKALCTLTDGNLSRQLQFLQEEGLVEVWKGFKNRRPQTLCRLTPEGRKRFLEYVSTLEKVVSDAADVARQSRNVRLPAPEGFSPA